MRHDAEFPDAEGGAQVWGSGIGGIKGRETYEAGVDVVDGLPQLVVAAPSADQQKGKAGAALVQECEARVITRKSGGKSVQGTVREGAGFGGDPIGGFIQVIPFKRGGFDLHDRAGDGVFCTVSILGCGGMGHGKVQ